MSDTDKIKKDFREFLENHPKMDKEKPAPKDMYVNLLSSEGALDINLRELNIPGFTTSYEALNAALWANVIRPIYNYIYRPDGGKKPMDSVGTFWNHYAAINKFIEFLKKEEGITKELDLTDSKLKAPILKDFEGPKHIDIPHSVHFWNYITAIRTKPFLLLAGISGTGKSRIVRELAFKSCPPYLRDKEGTTPGNYCMIEVKPNWHDSTEVLGYYSNLNESYQFTKFVRFLVKAKMFPDVPFFLCLDEMNLAPVEQYFAEILSILETRKHPKKEDGTIDMEHIHTGVIVESKYFQEDVSPGLKKFVNPTTGESYSKTKGLTDWEIYLALDKPTKEEIEKQSPAVTDEIKNSKSLSEHGLTLPDNVIIIGTVNMDDTTHQFSRKVIDRAMTIEMNGGNLKSMFGGSKKLEYIDDKEVQEKWQHSFKQPFVNADEVIEAFPEYAEEIIEKLPERLDVINQALKGTPFEVSYRVLNELTVMVGVMLENKTESQSFDDILNEALNNILLMKILPRIEGDADMFNLKDGNKSRLDLLLEISPEIEPAKEESSEEDSDEEKTPKQEVRQTAKDKIQEMIERLRNQEFTRFWP